ncbi:MAG: Type leader peptidase family protein [Planctomycetota bacterium]|nr:Type leader peptidase family protein [Planctomycetota bacterium]
MSRFELLPWLVVAFVTLVAGATDLWRFKVYNVLTFPALLGGVLVSSWLGGLSGLGYSLMGAAVGFGVLLLFFALGGVGAGDVKLFAAIGAWLGPGITADLFAVSALAAGGYALGLVILRGGLGQAVVEVTLLGARMFSPGSWSRSSTRIETEVCRPDRRRRLVPFAAVTCLAFFAMSYVQHLDRFAHRPSLVRAGSTVSQVSLIGEDR